MWVKWEEDKKIPDFERAVAFRHKEEEIEDDKTN
jgi:hypothetical protein